GWQRWRNVASNHQQQGVIGPVQADAQPDRRIGGEPAADRLAFAAIRAAVFVPQWNSCGNRRPERGWIRRYPSWRWSGQWIDAGGLLEPGGWSDDAGPHVRYLWGNTQWYLCGGRLTHDGGPEIKVFNSDGSLRLDFNAFHTDFLGGVHAAV